MHFDNKQHKKEVSYFFTFFELCTWLPKDYCTHYCVCERECVSVCVFLDCYRQSEGLSSGGGS